MRFFGRPMPVSAAPAFFAAKGKAPVAVAWSRPLRDGRYRCEVVSTYSPQAARDVWGLTQACMDDLARVIRRHPSCWVLNYRYFRKTPTDGELAQLRTRVAHAVSDRAGAHDGWAHPSCDRLRGSLRSGDMSPRLFRSSGDSTLP